MKSPETYDIVVIGGGIAGLASAIRLKKRFSKVLVLEKNERVGGKLDTLEWKGYRWDKGPSLFTEPELVDELFDLWDKNPRDYFNYKRLRDSCSYFFQDNSSITLSSDDNRTAQSIAKTAGASSVEAFNQYKDRSKELFESVGDYFISNPQPGVRSLLRKELVSRYRHLVKREVRKPLHRLNAQRFQDQRMVQIFDRYGTYNGSNPFQMSGLYSTIAHVELNKGAFFPEGGMRSIVDALEKLALEIGVEIHCNTEVAITKNDDGTFQLHGKQALEANMLVCAIDHETFYRNVMPELENPTKKDMERSTSGLIFYWAVEGGIANLGVHNILFSRNYASEFEQLFQKKALPSDPTFYIHVSSTINSEDAPSNGQNWFVMINTPAGVIPTLEDRIRMKQQLLDRVQQQFGVDVSNKILFEDFWDCHSIQRITGSYMGALYGPSSNTLTSSLKRHGNVSDSTPNLFFCGGTVHPGGGIPLVLRSAKIVDELIK